MEEVKIDFDQCTTIYSCSLVNNIVNCSAILFVPFMLDYNDDPALGCR